MVLNQLHIFDYGKRYQPLPDFDLTDTVLLFPPEDGVIYDSPTPPRQIIMLDGSWKQAHRIKKRVPNIRNLPRLSLEATLNLPRIRQPHFTGGMSTMEACIQALALYNPPSDIEYLIQIYCLWIEQVRQSTGIRKPLLPGTSFKEARRAQDIEDGKL